MRKLIFLLLMLPVICFAEDERLQELQKNIATVEAKLSEISKAPSKIATDKINRLDAVIKTLPDRKAKAGRITMKEYLQSLKFEIEKNPGEYVSKEIQRLVSEKDRLNVEVQTVAEEIQKRGLKDEKID